MQVVCLGLEPPKIMTDEAEIVAKRRKVDHPGTGAHAWPSSHGPAYQTVAPVAQSAAHSAAAPPATTAWPGAYPAHSWPESERSLLGSARLFLNWLTTSFIDVCCFHRECSGLLARLLWRGLGSLWALGLARIRYTTSSRGADIPGADCALCTCWLSELRTAHC